MYKRSIKVFLTYSLKSIKFVWCSSKEYTLLTIVSIIIGAVQAFPGMYLVNFSIDLLTQKVDFETYIKTVAVIIIIMLSMAILSIIVNNRLGYVKQRFNTKVRLDIDDICLKTEYINLQSKTFLENKNFALTAMNNGSLDVFIQSLNQLISSFIIMIGVLYIISTASFFILIPMVIALAIELYTDYLNARHNFIDTKESIEYGRKSSYLQSISTDFSFAKEIRLFNLKDRFKARMDEVEQLLYRLRNDRFKESYRSNILMFSAQTLLDISIYLYFGYKVLVSAAITLGQFTLYSSAIRKLKDSIGDIIYVITNAIVNTEYLKGFFDFMKLKEEHSDNKVTTTRIPQAEIRFENVSFRYPCADSDTLKNINITIKAGETLLIVGENGSGKSTFAKLLCGLYKPTRGRILLNGTDISTIDHKQYIRQISAVFQDYNLFAMPISENIGAMNECDESKIQYAVNQVNLSDKVNNTVDGIQTQLYRIFDENGVEFSGGEMQRLAIARAICKDTPILVLDEPTSALDPKSEYEIYSSFKKISKNRTAVYISHRLSSIKFSDKIAVFNDGEIVEYGTHDALMKKNGIYADLYTIQSGLYLKEVSQ